MVGYLWTLLAVPPTSLDSAKREIALMKNISYILARDNISGGVVLNQAGRHLLEAARLKGYWNGSDARSVHTTYIKLQGVDSAGNVS